MWPRPLVLKKERGLLCVCWALLLASWTRGGLLCVCWTLFLASWTRRVPPGLGVSVTGTPCPLCSPEREQAIPSAFWMGGAEGVTLCFPPDDTVLRQASGTCFLLGVGMGIGRVGRCGRHSGEVSHEQVLTVKCQSNESKTKTKS